MNLTKLCIADLHLHTNLSNCVPNTTTISSYLEHCDSEGIKKIGIANHLYSYIGIDHTLKIKDEISLLQNSTSVQILTGCEMEMFYDEEFVLDKKTAGNFDYVLLAASHIFNQMQHYEKFDLSSSNKIRDLLIDNFKRACFLDLGVPTAICHPLYPICAPNQQEILDSMTDEQLIDCYTLAAKHNKSIEIHACLYRDTVELDQEGLSPSYINMLSIAKQCGCKFYFGSDAHETQSFVNKHALLEHGAERAGICKEDLWHLAKI